MHDAKDTLLHLSSVGGAENDELLGGEVDTDAGLVTDVFQVLVGNELSRVHDCEVGAASSEVLLDGTDVCTNQHLLHEEGVVGAARDDTSLDSEILVPASVAIDDEQLQKEIRFSFSSG